jgi:hypothetical protein
MSSDKTIPRPDVRFLPAGPGMNDTFACAECDVFKPMAGRKLKVVRKGRMRGLRAWVCASCSTEAKPA